MLMWTVALASGCKGQKADAACDDLCRELVDVCDYAAFPDLSSCLQGCTYNFDEGADIEGQLDCVYAAECDTFTIVECEHDFGVE
jgi:hypothetical protein